MHFTELYIIIFKKISFILFIHIVKNIQFVYIQNKVINLERISSKNTHFFFIKLQHSITSNYSKILKYIH